MGQNEQQCSQPGEGRNCLPHMVLGCHYYKIESTQHAEQTVEMDESIPRGGGCNNAAKFSEQLIQYFQSFLLQDMY